MKCFSSPLSTLYTSVQLEAVMQHFRWFPGHSKHQKKKKPKIDGGRSL